MGGRESSTKRVEGEGKTRTREKERKGEEGVDGASISLSPHCTLWAR